MKLSFFWASENKLPVSRLGPEGSRGGSDNEELRLDGRSAERDSVILEVVVLDERLRVDGPGLSLTFSTF